MSSTARNDVRDPDDFYETPAWCTDAILPHLMRLAPGSSVLEPNCGRGAIVERLLAYGAVRNQITAVEFNVERAQVARVNLKLPVVCEDFLLWSRKIVGPSPIHEPLFSTGPTAIARKDTFDCVISNPAFRIAMAVIEAALALTAPRGGEVAMLLRLAWLASQERAAFHREHPADIYVLGSRPSFCASLRCKADCGWHVLQEIDAPRAKRCPSCDERVVVTTSDSADYAWFVWGPGRGNRWFLLDTPEGS